jgi:hypothetical protein
MPTYNYLPETIINTIDGGLVSPAVPSDDSVLILGTACFGPINTPYQVTDRGTAFNTFGPNGTLERSIGEVATYSDNITAFRIGTTPMLLADVGADTTTGTATPGFTISFNGDVSSTSSTGYVPPLPAHKSRTRTRESLPFPLVFRTPPSAQIIFGAQESSGTEMCICTPEMALSRHSTGAPARLSALQARKGPT